MNLSILILIFFQGQMQFNPVKMSYQKFIFKTNYMKIGTKKNRKKVNKIASQSDISYLNKFRI